MNDILDLLKQLYANDQVKYLIYLVVANLLTGIGAGIKRGDVKLAELSNWLCKRVIPLLTGYGGVAIIALSNPELAWVRDAAFATLTLTLLGYVFNNLKDFGVNLPESIAGK